MESPFTCLHNIVVNLHARRLDDAEVSLQIPPADVLIRFRVVRRTVKEDPGASVVLDNVVEDDRPKNRASRTCTRKIEIVCHIQMKSLPSFLWDDSIDTSVLCEPLR